MIRQTQVPLADDRRGGVALLSYDTVTGKLTMRIPVRWADPAFEIVALEEALEEIAPGEEDRPRPAGA